ncbi:MAG: hypothetical protein WBQ41_09650 [Solirubrobacterales bacterium]
MWVEEMDQPGLEAFGGKVGSREFVGFAVGAELLEYSAVLASSKVKRRFNPKPDRRAQAELEQAFDLQGGLTASSFLSHCVADMLAGAMEDLRGEIEELDEAVRKQLPVAKEDLDYYRDVNEHYLDRGNGSLMVALGALAHRAISLATSGEVPDLPMFRPVEGLDWREWITVDDKQWDVPLHMGLAPKWDQAAETYYGAVTGAGIDK